MPEDFLVFLAVSLPMILLAFTVHEYSHARTALWLGDPTAADEGRVTLNPLAHLDVVGLLALLLLGFGWARPVPYDRGALFAANPRHGRWAELAVAAAGPASNLLLAGVLRAALLALPVFPADMGRVLGTMLLYGVLINAGLFVFNLLPIHPLDGFTVLKNLLPLDASIRFEGTRAFGSWILLGILLLSRSGGFPFLCDAQGALVRHLYRIPL